jgi:cell division transport system permease protein
VRRVEYYFRETAAGLRRNGVVAFAAMSTAFIALFLFGLALLIGRELNLIIDAYTANVQVSVYLTDPVKSDTVARLQEKLQGLPAVASVDFESKAEAWERYKSIFASQPALIENVDPESIPASLRVNLSDTALYEQVTAAMGCAPDPEQDDEIVCTEPGVREVRDQRKLLDVLTTLTRLLSWGVLTIAVVMLVSAVVLVANTLRMGMFARRKEIGIMRLVGATNWRIRVPFLIEGLVESLLGAMFAILGLFMVKILLVDRLRETLPAAPFIRNADVLAVLPWVLVAAAFVAVIAGTFGMRRFLDV